VVTGAGLAGLIRAAALAAAHRGHPPGPAIGRQAARRLARQELSRAIYHPGVPLTVRVERAIARLLDAAGNAVPGGWWALVALTALGVIAAGAVLAWIGPVARSRPRPSDPVLHGERLSARDHRQNAERQAAAGDFTAAIIESVRAIAVDLEERGVLPARVGRTADELAAEASRLLPDQAVGLSDAARLFDDVRYGTRAGTAAGYERVRDLDTRIRAARLAAAAALLPAGAAAGPVS
jgi:Domain of unknown function (DUF4129)